MSANVAILDNHLEQQPWGVANDRRGMTVDENGVLYVEHASDFVRAYPVGTTLSADAFDGWLQARGLLVVPPIGVSKNSDAWLGHLQRRNVIRKRLNGASVHPRMAERGSTPFTLDYITGGYEVCAPREAISKREMLRRIESVIDTKSKQLDYLMQSEDWSSMPPHERGIGEALYDDIEALKEDIHIAVNRIERKHAKLEHRMKLSREVDTRLSVPRLTSD